MAQEQWYAIVFKRAFRPGEHWDPAHSQPSDLRQHWQVGDLWATGTVLADPLPAHLMAVPLAGPPPPGARWDRQRRAFVE